ncbi:MAG: hypothetical protein WA957_16045, partial [Alteraurantiacibacter sp.]
MSDRVPSQRSIPAAHHALPRTFAQRIALPVTHLQILLLAAIMFGGGGVAYGMRNLAIQLIALAILAFHSRLVLLFLKEAPRPLLLLVGATMALPLLQAIALPPDLWQSLPGREPAAESFAIAGLGADKWFSFSISPM